jgi:hypothetical protein
MPDEIGSFLIEYLHRFDRDKISSRLDTIQTQTLAQLNQIQALLEQIMLTMQDFKDAFTKMEVATTAVGQRIAELTEQLKNGDLSPEDEAAVLDELLQKATVLEGFGKKVEDPVPGAPTA